MAAIGKSDGIKQMSKLVYLDFWKNGGVAPQTLYYSGPTMPYGVVVGLEDVVWTSELGVTIKRITTDFQERAVRLITVEMKGAEVRTAKRIAFWASCVDSQADERLRDPFLMYNVKSDPNRRKEIIGHMQAQDEGEQPPKEYDFEMIICQTLIYDLKRSYSMLRFPLPKGYDLMEIRGLTACSAIWSDPERHSDT